ncbi:MAG TPA: SDR family NAD(P)-dependent oxidoreductase [Pseudonocardia sp.]|uniref:SDR family NAD(P)-dependent oxidoreductase n=1 Tax=Pseudonocardia sp. TaxID=60912 RepID=UPI002B8A4B61|nr:SDR family NAD(P)-dependent oxidoreductase [Pseudonocardia sp.]HTF55442.1 SDR family NAD(P)-dependent oxidoreductase [Pseudonocardia sp.]
MTDDKMLGYLKKVAAELQDTRERLDHVRAQAREPIAIIGTACRFPGGVNSSAALWELVAGGVDAMTEFPDDRGWDLEAFSALGPLPVGGFLDDAAGFDSGFFGISPREAFAMDPQQRLALECCYEALEHAGLDISRLHGSDTAVYLGTNGQDYLMLLGSAADGADAQGHAATGNIASVLSGRVSYLLGLEGPSVSVDTACSSSLVALHLAARALRSGECSLALVGGVTVMSTPAAFVEFERQGGLASDGRCKAFAEAADGTSWGEGAGVLVVERLSDARRLGHRVLAVVRGTAVNSDGASNGLTAPNGLSQRRVIARALADARLKAADVDVVEAHGTGTALGDPIEAQALLSSYGGERAEPVYLGSIKSNFGHTQAAAGVAGVLKMVEALCHGEIPRTLHVTRRTPHVDWSASAVELATEHRVWPETGRPRRAGVSSFGISGTNAHVIVEQAPEAEVGPLAARPANVLVPWVVSGAAPAAVAENLARLSGLDRDPVDIGWALATTRASLTERAVAVGGSHAELVGCAPVRGRAGGEGRVGVVFSGQGAQRPGMGRALAVRFPVFAAAFEQVLAEFEPEVREAIDDERVHRTEFAQPGLFAFEVALYRLLESWGARPRILVGHSIGELTAAYLAGVWSLRDACRLVSARARLMAALPEGGAMVALDGTEAAVREVLTEGVSIAAVNGPGAVVISGADAEVAAIADAWAGKTRRLRVSRAFHSALMEPMLEEFGAVARQLGYSRPALPVISNLTGQLAEGLTDPEYWVRQVREAVRFADGVSTLLDAGVDAITEVGPRAALSGAVTEIAGERAVTVAPLGRDEDEVRAALVGAARLWVSGVDINWAETFAGFAPRRVDLPSYAFQRERYWPAAPATRVGDVSAAGLVRADHPLLGAVVSLADGGWVLSGRLARHVQPWLSDHVVLGSTLFPGTGFVELALRAGELVGCDALEELTLAAPLTLPERGGVHVQVVVRDREVGIYSSPEDAGPDEWTPHATGVLTDAEPAADEAAWAASWPPPGAEPIDVTGFYEGFALGGFDYGPAFRGLAAAWRGSPDNGEVFVEVELPGEAGAAEQFGMHPALLDVVLQSIGLLAQGSSRVPFSFDGVRLAATGARHVRARLRPRGDNPDGGFGLTVVDLAGGLVLSVARVIVREVNREQLTPAAAGRAGALLELAWTPLRLPEVATGTAPAVIDARGLVLGADAFGLSVTEPRPAEAPEFVALTVAGGDPGEQLARVLAQVQQWLADESLASAHLVVFTRDAVVVDDGARVGGPAPVDVAGAAVWGLVRTLASENPGRVTLVDSDEASLPVWPAAVAVGVSQVALRGGRCWTPALARMSADLDLPDGRWRAAYGGAGSVQDIHLLPAGPPEPLAAGQVRIEVRAAGVNFRDVLSVLGMYPDEPAPLGLEGAGVVTEVGPGVEGFALGDRVLGMFPAALGSSAVADARWLAPVPRDWSFTEAASVPVVFLTAFYALRDLAGLQAGDRVVVHAAAGGVGMAAVALARHWGAHVLATASPAKQPFLRELGIDPADIASSRNAEFERMFGCADVVLDSLAGELVDASLRLLRRGGRFIEMGKTDIRDPARIAAVHGVQYRAFDLVEAGPERTREMLLELMELFRSGAITPVPVTVFEARRVREAFRYMAAARHVGKVVLRLPRPITGPVLITGGTGGLGSVVARHLVAAHGVRELVLLSRSGEAPELRQQLEAAGASVRIAACDVTDRAALGRVIDEADGLGAVIHTAGVLDDSTIDGLTSAQLGRVLAPKLHGGELLDELTRDHDLSHFIVFSSISGVVGSAGQGNYAAANTALDALIQRRRAAGRPGTSLAWGPWSTQFGMTSGLSEADIARMRRSGVVPFTEATGTAALDAALRATSALPVPVLTAPPGAATAVPPMLAGVVRLARRAAAGAASGVAMAERLRALPVDQHSDLVIEQVRAEVATVLGHGSAEQVDPLRSFSELGFDSLTAVELRNQLGAVSGVRLASTVVFDYPTVTALAEHLLERLEPAGVSRPDEHRYALSPECGAGLQHDAVSSLALGAVFHQAVGAGRAEEAMMLMTRLATFRPTFSSTEDLANIPKPLTVSQGPATVGIVCLPSFFGRSGPQEYARLAGQFQRSRPMSVLSEPGFRQGEPLPAHLTGLVLAQVDILSRSMRTVPLVLLGHSSGGLVAHALARYLEDVGQAPAGLVLLDTFAPPKRGLTGIHWSGLLDVALRHNFHDVDDDAWLTAMAHYFEFGWHEIGASSVPTLQLWATDPITGATEPAGQRSTWVFSRHATAVEVPGDHFSMLGEHVQTTAAAVEQWLAQL